MQLVDLLGLFIPDRVDAIMGSDGNQGTAQYSPYMAPFPIIVRAPAPLLGVSMRHQFLTLPHTFPRTLARATTSSAQLFTDSPRLGLSPGFHPLDPLPLLAHNATSWP